MSKFSRNSFKFLLLFFVFAIMAACEDEVKYTNDNLGNFDEIWTFIDEHYCFFDDDRIDWNYIGNKYRPEAEKAGSQRVLFDVMSRMINELRDGHVNLSSWFETSYYRKWWSDYPQNYNERLVQQYYLNFEYKGLGAMYYGILQPYNVGYIRIPTFSSGLGDSNIDAILNYFTNSMCAGIVIDVRDNGGGELTNVEKYVNRFIDKPIVAGYMMHKTGPGHHDFSEPFEYRYSPVGEGHTRWPKPVAVLTNRSTFSAANNFVSIMKNVPTVTVVGATTGGGSGMPLSSELPNGWGIRISACRILDAQMLDTEFGVSPSEGWEVDLDPLAALSGRDTMLDAAIRAVTGVNP